MTAFNSNVYTAQTDGVSSIDTAVKGQDLFGKARWVFATGISGTNVIAQNDTINIAKLPAGARLLAVVVDQSAAAGSSVTLAITGNDGSNRTFVTAYDNNAAPNVVKPSEYTAALAAETTVVATLAGANPTDDVSYEFALLISLPNG